MTYLCSRAIGAFPVTIITNEEHSSEVSITKQPVEFGADITDHAYIEPKSVTLSGRIASNQSGFVGSTITAAAYQSLLKYQESRIPFMLVTGLNAYKDMLIQSVSVPVTVDNAGTLEFTIKVQQILIVGSGFAASVIGAIAGGQAASLAVATLQAGEALVRAAPTINRGDNVVADVSVDLTTSEGRLNAAALQVIS